MSQVSLDLSGIAASQPGVPEPIATALSALLTGHNDTDTKLTNVTTGHDHDGTDSKQIALSSGVSDYIAPASWSPTFTGFSTSPTVTAKKMKLGRLVLLWIDTTAAGVSDNTAFYITNLPYTPDITQDLIIGKIHDNGSTKTNPGRLTLTAASAQCQLFSDTVGSGWTASGNKYANFFIAYTTAS